MKKINILYIHHGTGIGGASISLFNLVKGLDLNKFNIKVACLKGGDHVNLFESAGVSVDVIGASTLNFSFNESRKKYWYFLPYYIIVFFVWIYTAFYVAPKYLREQKDYSILHLNSHVLTSWAYAAKKLRFKVVLHNREAIARGYVGIRYSILKSLIRKNCDYIINISQDNRDRLGLTERSCVIYNFVNIPDHYSIPFHNSEIKVLYLGGDAEIKGFSCVLQSLSFLDNSVKIIFGGRLSKDNYAELSVYQNVEVIGLVNNPYEYINKCDILITPFSTPHFSRPAIEAFAYGKPVIGSDVKGMDEIIHDNVNGLLFERNDFKKLAEAINFLALNPKIGIEMGCNGRDLAIRKFSPKASIAAVTKIYETLEHF